MDLQEQVKYEITNNIDIIEKYKIDVNKLSNIENKAQHKNQKANIKIKSILNHNMNRANTNILSEKAMIDKAFNILTLK